jgi:hypothetical protein
MADTELHKRFLLALSMTFLLACLSAAAFNYLVDPYGLFGSRRVVGFNELKPAAAEKVRVAKPYMASRVKPTSVIGGNSRPEMGLNPQSACWEDGEQSVFNTAIPGADVFMQVRYVQHAAESGETRRIFFGVDFLDFLVDPLKSTGHIDWNRLDRNSRLMSRAETGFIPIGGQQAADVFSGLFSLGAVEDSFLTVASQRNIHSPTRHENGFNPAQDYLQIIRGEGQSVLFMQKNAELRKRLHRMNLGIVDVNGQPSKHILALRRMLDWAETEGTEVVLFINPYHADYLVQIEESGNWRLLEEWKRQLAGVASEYGVALWDFNTFDRYSTEPPPARNDKLSILHWFWEPAHYRQELGDVMLANMLARPCVADLHPPFGVRVTPTSLESHLNRLRSDLHRFIQEHPNTVYRLGARAP